MKKLIVIALAASLCLIDPVVTDAEISAPQKQKAKISVEEANAAEAQSLTGRWAPVYESTPDHVDLEKIDDEISENFDLLCRVIYAESGNQGDYGMRLVCDVIINRLRCGEAFDSTLHDVLTAPGQFACIEDGGAERWQGDKKENVRKLCQEELAETTDTTIFYFRTNHYSPYGVPAYKYKDHYFSRRSEK